MVSPVLCEPEGRASRYALGVLILDGDSHGVAWHLELDRSILLPGRLVGGRLTLRAEHAVEARGVVVALLAEEHWRYTVTERDANGNTSSRVVTARADLLREPVQVHGALRLAAGETWQSAFELPVPAMGPATLQAEDAGLEWTLEAKLDIDDALDSGVAGTVVVAQPTALLRAGAVHVGEFALYEKADVGADGVTGSIAFEPVPLVCGEPFTGRVELQLPDATSLQEVRAELRIEVQATVGSGEHETIVAWAGQLAPEGSYEGTVHWDIAGSLDSRPLPTIELPHGRAHATFHVILARAWAQDTHLARDVAIATTSEL